MTPQNSIDQNGYKNPKIVPPSYLISLENGFFFHGESNSSFIPKDTELILIIIWRADVKKWERVKGVQIHK